MQDRLGVSQNWYTVLWYSTPGVPRLCAIVMTLLCMFQVARLVVETCDTRSALEAEGYAAWLAGSHLLEKGGSWDKALARFTRARCACSRGAGCAPAGSPAVHALCSCM
jgi:hypothetical protein